jgi:hypothetical protein
MTKDDKTGKATVQKLGVGAKQRDGFEYEFTCTFLIDQKTNTAEVQKDNTHIFESQGATLLTEAHGAKLIQWANDGEGYTPVDRNNTPEEVSSDLETVKKQIIEKATALGGNKSAGVKAVVKEFGNPNALKTVEDAQKYLEALNNIKE